MIPPKQKVDYEKIKTDDFVVGTIEHVLYDLNHEFKGWGKDEKGNPNPPQIKPAIRLVFSVEGYKHPHKTPWMKFNFNEKSNIFKKYISSLVEGASQYMEFDVDQLKGMRVKMLWKDNGDFQGIETIRPLDGKIKPILNENFEPEEPNDDAISF